MSDEAVVVLSWLVTAHLVGDFVLQTEWMAVEKFGAGSHARRALLWHVAVVGLVHAPLALVFGVPGALFAAVTAVSHGVIDRTKIALTHRADGAPDPGGTETEDQSPGPTLDRRWTPRPAGLFALDQVVHIMVLAVAWVVLLARSEPLPPFVEGLDRLIGGVDQEVVHGTVLTVLVLISLAIVNIRAASLLIGVLVRAPRAHRPPEGAAPPVPASPPVAYSLRVGPLVGRLEPDAPRRGPRTEQRSAASPARIGEAIGVLERLLIVGLVLTGAVATIGLVIAAKTLARFKQLDDREFAEYYLLGTLASVTVAVLSALVAQAVLTRA